MVLPRGSAHVGGHGESGPWPGDSGCSSAEVGTLGTVGGARGLGQTGEVLSRKSRLQVRISGGMSFCVPRKPRFRPVCERDRMLTVRRQCRHRYIDNQRMSDTNH